MAANLIMGAQADFALNLLREVSKQGQATTIVSPISVAIALSMVYAGAKDETAEQMNRLLANGAPESEVHQFYGQMLSSIRSGQKNYTLEMADKVYVQDGFPVLDAYKSTIEQYYAGQFESVNFAENEKTAKIINSFVENVTHNKIHDLIQADNLGELTRLILVNAIYFKGNWANQFDANGTEKQPFYVAEGNVKQVDMMHSSHNYIYQDAADYQVLGMPYAGEEVFMFVILPRKRFGLAQVMANLTGTKLLELVQNRNKEKVDVTLPKFKLESTHELTGPLKKLGIPNAVSDRANFGGITGQPLSIDGVMQKAFIEVNEEGTEAAAATSIGIVWKAMPKLFIADRPFGFILANGQGQQLFAGIFEDNSARS